MPESDPKPVGWIGDARNVVRSFPKAVRNDFGYALDGVQRGLLPTDFKPRNDVGPGVIQLMAEDQDGWYRVFYVAKLDDVVWVLHAFQKKTNQTSKVDVQRGKDAYATLIRHLAKGKKERAKEDQ